MRKHYKENRARLRMRANQRAAKERKRLARVASEEPMPDMSHCPPLSSHSRPTGFRVSITCLEDGERVSFVAARGPFGLTISPTLAGRKVACVLANYTSMTTAKGF